MTVVYPYLLDLLGECGVLGVSVESDDARVVLAELHQSSAIRRTGGHLLPWSHRQTYSQTDIQLDIVRQTYSQTDSQIQTGPSTATTFRQKQTDV